MRIVFFGTPESAVPFLDLCADRAEVPLVVTQPDRPAGRGLATAPTPVKAAAARRGLRLLQPEKPASALDQIQAAGADLGVVVAYGRIFPESVIAATRLGLLNVHFSLLPKYRGAAPIQWSLWRGEARTGVSLFWIDQGMDTGPLLLQTETAVAPDDDARTLEAKLLRLGVDALGRALATLARGEVPRRAQEGEATTAPMLEKAHGALAFDRPADAVHNQVRALCRWPVAFREWRDRAGRARRLGILKTLPPEETGVGDPGSGARSLDTEPAPRTPRPGTILSIDRTKGILVECSSGRIWLSRVQPEGRGAMAASDFANGVRLKVGDIL